MRNENDALRVLRNDLDFITERLPPNRHVAAFENLRRRHPHSIEFFADGMNGPHGYNCFMYALGIREFPAPLVAVCRRVDNAYIGSEFVTELIDVVLGPGDDDLAVAGSVAIYLDDAGRPKHAGIVEGGQHLISKWGTGHLWRHPAFETPVGYGDEVRFYKPPQPEDVLRRFQAYVERVSGERT